MNGCDRLRYFAFAFGLALWLSFDCNPGAGQQAMGGQSASSQAIPAKADPANAVPPQGAPIGPAVKPAPPTPIAVQKVQLGKPGWDPEWDGIVEQAVPPEFLTSSRVARDARPLCPRYRHLSDTDKKQFWAYFFQALAGAEAGLEPTSDVRHNDPAVAVRDPVTGHIARQEGLLQLAYMDSERYGCEFDWETDKHLPEKDPEKTILQPQYNLLCGMKILSNQLLARHWPLLTRKSYWITLQPGTISYQRFLKQMVNVPDVCREPEPMEEVRIRSVGATHAGQAVVAATANVR